LGASSTIICGKTIGQYAFVGAGAVVTNDVPDFALVAGVPARRVGWVCYCGMRLNVSGSDSTCRSCGKVYTIVDSVLHSAEVAHESKANPAVAGRQP